MAANAILQFFETIGDYNHETREMTVSVDDWAKQSTEVVQEIAEELHASTHVVLETMRRYEDSGLPDDPH